MVQLWWPFIRTDSVLFHVILQLSASNLETLKNRKAPRLAKLSMAECIRLLRERVQDESLGVSDQTMVAVATLAALEVRGHEFLS